MTASPSPSLAGRPRLPNGKEMSLRGTGLRRWVLGASLLAALVALPVLSVLALALLPSAGAAGDIGLMAMARYAGNTAALMAMVAVGVLTIGTSTAWLVTMYRFPGHRVFEWALILPLAVPAYVIGYIYVDLLAYAGPVQGALRAWFSWEKPTDYWFFELRSLPGAAAMMIMVFYPYVYLLARNAFIDQSVTAMEVARTLGLGPWRGFWQVAMPLARPALAIGMALALMEVIGDFGTVQQFAVASFTTGIYEVWLGMNNLAGAARLACLALGFVWLLIWLERSSRRGKRYHAAGRHFRALSRTRLSGGRSLVAFLACALPLLFGFILPMAVLFDWTLASWADQRWSDFFGDLWNTVSLAAVASVIAVASAVYLSYALRITSSPLLRVLARVAGTGYALPGSVIAVGVLLPLAWFDNAVDGLMRQWFGISTGLLLSGTGAILIFAYLVRFLALSMGAVGASLGRVTRSMDAAARTLGHDRVSLLRRVHFPLMRGGLLTALLIVFVEVVKELPATLILRPFNFSTLATRVFEFASDDQFEDIGVWAFAMVAVGIGPVLLLSIAIARARPGQAED